MPKPLLEVGGRPFLVWVMREALRWGIEEFVLLAAHLGERVVTSLGELSDALPRSVPIRVGMEPSPCGTGGALRHALPILDEQFLLLNGDSLFLGALGSAFAAFAADGADISCRVSLRAVVNAGRYGVATLRGDEVVGFDERPNGSGPGLINAGIYLMDRRVVELAGPVSSLERDVLPCLVKQGSLRGTVADGWFIDIGIPADLDIARQELPRRMRRPALFLDRDGVLNRDFGWVGSRARWEWMPGAIEAVRAATAAGWHVFVVTNQSGVARGYYTEADVVALHDWMAQTVRLAGGTIDDIRYCPYHPDGTVAGYRRASDWRKPAPGMILDLIRAWELDPAVCALVGDDPRDMAAAAGAGVTGHLFHQGDLTTVVRKILAACEVSSSCDGST
jgi:D-glycero-D-manno-heptose 1,7-bisphosphate phosphatase